MKNNIKLDISPDKFNFNYIDFHGDDRKFTGSFGDNMSLQMFHMKASSGQVSISLLNDKLKDINKIKNGVLILDEPCRGQSIKNQFKVVSLIMGLVEKHNCQIIVTSHSDIILKSLSDIAQYYDIKNNTDTTYNKFMLSQLSNE
jgi:predicted ATPase